jgi:hypothetical protein
MALVVATVAQRYRLRVVPGYRVELEPLVTLRTRRGMPMTLTPRVAASRHAAAVPQQRG